MASLKQKECTHIYIKVSHKMTKFAGFSIKCSIRTGVDPVSIPGSRPSQNFGCEGLSGLDPQESSIRF